MESDTSLDLVWLCPSFSTLYIEEPVAALERWTSVQKRILGGLSIQVQFKTGSTIITHHKNNKVLF